MAQFGSDAFTAADSTTIQSHDAGWTKVTGLTGDSQITSNRARAAATTAIRYYKDNAYPYNADYSVSADIYVASTTTNYNAGVIGRASDSANTAYLARLRSGTGWQLFKTIAGSSTQLGSSVAQSISVGNVFNLKLDMSGTTIKLVVDGVDKITPGADNSITAAGKPGIYFDTGGQTASGTVGLHVDNFSADAASATTVTRSGPTSGYVGVASTNFTVGADGVVAGTVTVTPSDGGGGTFVPTTVDITSASPTATFTYTAGSAGVKTISFTNNGSLSNPSNISFTATVLPSPPTGAATSQLTSGQTRTITFSTTNTPTSGLATITALGGGVTQGPIAVTLGSGTGSIEFTEIEPDEYSTTITLTNEGGTNSVTGTNNFEIFAIGDGIDGDEEEVVTVGYATNLRNAQLDAITTFAGSGALLRVYDGTRPATGGTATNLLAEFTLGAPFAPSAAAGVLSPTLSAGVDGLAAGTATWFRIVKSNGTTHVLDGSTGTSGTDMILNTVSITVGVDVSVTSFTITRGNS